MFLVFRYFLRWLRYLLFAFIIVWVFKRFRFQTSYIGKIERIIKFEIKFSQSFSTFCSYFSARSCDPPPWVLQGNFTCPLGHFFKNVCHLECNLGYQITGPANITCGVTIQWSQHGNCLGNCFKTISLETEGNEYYFSCLIYIGCINTFGLLQYIIKLFRNV